MTKANIVFCMKVAAAWAGLTLMVQAADVQLTGPFPDDLRSKLSGGSLLVEQSAAETPPSTQDILSAAQADYRRLLAVLYGHGYYGGVISIQLDGREASSIVPVNPPKSVTTVLVRVDPGPVFKFSQARIAPLPTRSQPHDSFAVGQVATLGALRSAVEKGVEDWRGAGHAKAALKSQTIVARHVSAELSADLVLAPGPKLTFGPLQTAGNVRTRTDRLIDIAGLPVGRTFDPEEVARAANRLRRTGAFQSIAMIEAEGVGPNDTQIITAQVTEAKLRRFGVGFEVATQEGGGLRAFWMHRNLLGGAEKLRFDAEIKGIGGTIGGMDYRLGVRFDRPATFNEDTNFYALAEIEQEDGENLFSRQASVGVGIERIASEKRRYRFGLGLRRGLTRDAFGERDYTLFEFPLGVNFDYRDVELDPRKGYYADIGVTPFLTLSGADSGVLSLADLRGYHSFGEDKRTTLAIRAQVGSLYGPSLADAPADFLFFSGGGGTVRGHEYQSLGVDLGGGNIVGGRSFVNVSAEVRWRSQGSFGLVAFADAGYVGEEEFFDGSGEWQTGAGVGLRYDTRIGPIRVDLAVPTSGETTDTQYQIYIGIGQSF